MPMTADAKRALSTTIRALRERLLGDLHNATEGAYLLSLPPEQAQASLSGAMLARRARLEAWITEQKRIDAATRAATPPDHRRAVEKQAAYTLLNRLIILRLMEAGGLRRLPLVTGGWRSKAYTEFRDYAPDLVHNDPSEGYAFLLGLVFDDLALDLPGIFGSAGVADLVPVPPATLRHAIETLDHADLASCWSDDMTLGWVYQYWNDPEREALDAKLNSRQKLENHEIASKTQMFTERYMVDWLLHNTLGPLWLATCKKNGWIPQVVADGTLDRLEQRRADWRAKRDAGEVSLTDLMPLHTDAERRWAYYVPQTLPDDAHQHAPDSIRDLKILDPAAGSGHFLVVAVDLLFALYREEAHHRAASTTATDPLWSDTAIAERILSHNLHGVDLDSRAMQIAAAALWLKAQSLAPGARPPHLNLVAANLRLAQLPDDDPSITELRQEIERETGIPAKLTNQILHALKGADHLGSLLQIDRAVEDAIAIHEQNATLGRLQPDQGSLFSGFAPQQTRIALPRDAARASVLDSIERFLDRHTRGEDLGIRLQGQQLAAGIRFIRLMQEKQYHLIVANPPYQGTSKMADTRYIEKHYPLGKSDLYAAFLQRGLQLVREGGLSAMLTMRNWMFIKQYAGLRQNLLENYDLRALHDLSSGAFEEISAAQVVVSVVTSVFRRWGGGEQSIALKAFSDDTVLQVGETLRKRSATLCQVGRYEFAPEALKVVPEWPLVYWWGEILLKEYRFGCMIGGNYKIRQGLASSDNARRLRRFFELQSSRISLSNSNRSFHNRTCWVPHIMGASGLKWFDRLNFVIDWGWLGVGLKVFHEMNYVSYSKRIPSEDSYFKTGIAFSTIGSNFSGRVHRFPGTIDTTGCSVYPDEIPEILCLFNSSLAGFILSSLNPTIHYTNGDVERLTIFRIDNSAEIFAQVESSFGVHESHREASVEFKHPGPSPWGYAQDWAQRAVDRPEGEPLPAYEEELDAEPATDHLSYALGVALGRFGSSGEGVLDPETADLSGTLPHGVLMLDGTLAETSREDDLGHAACAGLWSAWAEYGGKIETKRGGLREWLRQDFFKDVHRKMYENRPIHWPLSSESRTFVVFVTIHRWQAGTLTEVLAKLMDVSKRLEGEVADLQAVRDGADKKAAQAAEKRLDRVQKWREELTQFVMDIEQCAERGAPSPGRGCAPRERDARYVPVLDDGVMINSAALWPLLEPQWKDPKKWWTELANSKGKKDYDWARLAMRYWPTRVDAKCRKDPSLGVAHGCFWLYHPARAWAWELRLQDEIGPDFRITEAGYLGPDGGVSAGDAVLRAKFLREQPAVALAAVQKEAERRMGRGKSRKVVAELVLLESGLWGQEPEACWDMELALSTKQGVEFFLRAPDEAEARAAFEEENPERVQTRKALVAGLTPPVDLFDESDDEEGDAGEEEGEEADEEQEA